MARPGALAVALAVVGAVVGGIELGVVPIPLRSPPGAPGERMARAPPPGTLPFPFDAAYDAGNALLRDGASRWFAEDGVRGVETVAVASKNGTLAMVDERGEVRRRRRQPACARRTGRQPQRGRPSTRRPHPPCSCTWRTPTAPRATAPRAASPRSRRAAASAPRLTPRAVSSSATRRSACWRWCPTPAAARRRSWSSPATCRPTRHSPPAGPSPLSIPSISALTGPSTFRTPPTSASGGAGAARHGRARNRR
jgi:hypothetical protein